MFKYPSDPEPKLEITLARLEKKDIPLIDEGGMSSGAGYEEVKYNSGYIQINSRNHLGTHIDAPAHKLSTRPTLDEYPLNYFVNTFEFLNLTERKLWLNTPSRGIRPTDIKDLVQNKKANALIIDTGYTEMLQTRINEKRPISKEEKLELENKFTYMYEGTVDKLKENYPLLRIIGVDSFSFDPFGSNSKTHRKMFEYGILPLESLWNLSTLNIALKNNIGKKATLYSVPLNITGGDAAPTSAFVQIE